MVALEKEFNIMAMDKDGERYIFMFSDEHHEGMIQVLLRFADNIELNFTWGDAAEASRRIREEMEILGY